MAELLKYFEPDIETISLVPSDGGRFEITVNEKLLFSKLETHRHAEKGEITLLIKKLLREGL